MIVSTFYKFVEIADAEAVCARLHQACADLKIKGTILIAREGLNATVSGSQDAVESLHALLRAAFGEFSAKQSSARAHPFQRLKVKIKPEIVTMAAPDADPARQVGTYVEPGDWNALIAEPDVIVIDTRNAYEIEVGTFPGARNPGTQTFSEFPAFVGRDLADAKDRKIAMFCTGGIRCEKASSYLLSQGFRDVYHLEGGILKYLETVPAEDSLWHGECFVFDDRVALQHGVRQGTHGLCEVCGYPVAKDTVNTSGRCAKCATNQPA